MNENSLTSYSDSVVHLFERIYPLVVSIQSETRKIGSGVVLDANGYIVTCSHLVRKVKDVEVGFYDNRTYPAKIIGKDTRSNLALLKIEASNLNSMNIGDSENLRTGQVVFALANSQATLPSITQGIITSRRSSLSPNFGKTMIGHVVITDTNLNFRYLGGPLVDVEGNLIGLNTAFRRGRGIAIEVNKIKNIIIELKKYGNVKYAYLGLVLRRISLPRDLARQDAGLIVISVKKDTPAKKAGILIGDVLIKFNNKSIGTVDDLHELLTLDVIEKSTDLSVLRGEKLQDLKITPGQMID